MSSQIVPASFDPFATHPFTNINNMPPQAQVPPPYPYPRPIPTAHSYAGHQHPTHATVPTAPSSLPTAQTPVHAPQPVHASPTATRQQHVFEPFKLERSSPDLLDVLAKKGSPGRWPTNDARHKAKQ